MWASCILNAVAKFKFEVPVKSQKGHGLLTFITWSVHIYFWVSIDTLQAKTEKFTVKSIMYKEPELCSS